MYPIMFFGVAIEIIFIQQKKYGYRNNKKNIQYAISYETQWFE